MREPASTRNILRASLCPFSFVSFLFVDVRATKHEVTYLFSSCTLLLRPSPMYILPHIPVEGNGKSPENDSRFLSRSSSLEISLFLSLSLYLSPPRPLSLSLFLSLPGRSSSHLRVRLHRCIILLRNTLETLEKKGRFYTSYAFVHALGNNIKGTCALV